MKGTLLLTVLSIRSSYSQDIEQPVDLVAGEVPDTLQWWIGDQTWRIRTYAIDHDIHTHAVARTGREVLELARQNNRKHYAGVTTAEHILDFRDCEDAGEVTKVLADARLSHRLEVAVGRFAFWKPDGGHYRTLSTPDERAPREASSSDDQPGSR